MAVIPEIAKSDVKKVYERLRGNVLKSLEKLTKDQPTTFKYETFILNVKAYKSICSIIGVEPIIFQNVISDESIQLPDTPPADEPAAGSEDGAGFGMPNSDNPDENGEGDPDPDEDGKED